jgi:riboflavin synthase
VKQVGGYIAVNLLHLPDKPAGVDHYQSPNTTMFTGLVEALAPVERIEVEGDGRALVIAAPFAAELAAGDSVAINGACLTVVTRDDRTCRFQAGPETLRKTNLGELRPGERVNLERALRAGDRLGGHIVQGHVDGLGRIVSQVRHGEWETVWFSCPAELAAQMVPKGSVAVDGISLTLVDVTADGFSVALIPHTLAVTTLGFKRPGASVNLETDILAKYVWKCLHGSGVTWETLRKTGFASAPASLPSPLGGEGLGVRGERGGTPPAGE